MNRSEAIKVIKNKKEISKKSDKLRNELWKMSLSAEERIKKQDEVKILEKEMEIIMPTFRKALSVLL